MSTNRNNVEKLRTITSSFKTINNQSILGLGNIDIAGGIYFQDTGPVLNPGQKALWVKEFPDGSFDILVVKG